MMTPLASSTCSGASYDEGERRLDVQLKNGDVYSYINVPREHFDALIAADSPGKYLAQNIKGKYGARKAGEI